MLGSHRITGAPLDGDAHLAQSIAIILSTPLGSRIARRDFGSQLPDLIDAPVNPTTTVRLYAAAAAALMRWEPRIQVVRVALTASEGIGGRWELLVTYRRAKTTLTATARVDLRTGALA